VSDTQMGKGKGVGIGRDTGTGKPKVVPHDDGEYLITWTNAVRQQWMVTVDVFGGTGRVVSVSAPIARRFIGQPLTSLLNWAGGFGGRVKCVRVGSTE